MVHTIARLYIICHYFYKGDICRNSIFTVEVKFVNLGMKVCIDTSLMLLDLKLVSQQSITVFVCYYYLIRMLVVDYTSY